MYDSTTRNGYPGYVAYMPAGRNPGGMMGSNNSNGADDDKYITTTKIMVVALAVLFAVVFFVICFHLYAKWVWSTTTPARAPGLFTFWPRRWRRRRNNRASEVILDANMFDMNLVVGLDKAAVEAIPTFRYKKGFETGALECAICLGQFQDDELGRTLPKCGHHFHQECIDMWLYSHSTCPLCRAVLDPAEPEYSTSLNLELPHIPVLRTERTRTPRRLASDQTILPQPDEPAAGEESEQHPEQETGYKSADSIPANILFWGNLLQQAGADSRVVNIAPQQAPSGPSQIAIDIDIDMSSTTAPNQHSQTSSPAAASASAPL